MCILTKNKKRKKKKRKPKSRRIWPLVGSLSIKCGWGFVRDGTTMKKLKGSLEKTKNKNFN